MRQNDQVRNIILGCLLVAILSATLWLGLSGSGGADDRPREPSNQYNSVSTYSGVRAIVAPNDCSYRDLTENFKHAVKCVRHIYVNIVDVSASGHAPTLTKSGLRRKELSIITVSNSGQLVQAVRNAAAGDTIQLASGVYSGVTLNNIDKSAFVTITSADPANRAVLTDLSINGSEGLRFANLEVAIGKAGAIKVVDSSNIQLSGLNIHGSLDGNPHNDKPALQIRSSTDISVLGSEFQQVYNGITHLDNTNVRISGNYFHDIGMDAIRGAGTSGIEISNNYITSIPRNASDHTDAIQFWTANTKVAADGITITGNIYIRGDGSPAQGIFMADEGNVGYKNVKIADNLIVGSLYNGIFLEHATGAQISGNKIIGYSDIKPWIRLIESQGVSLYNNDLPSLKNEKSALTVQYGNNFGASTSDGAAVVRAWLDQHAEALSKLHPGVASALGVLGSSPAPLPDYVPEPVVSAPVDQSADAEGTLPSVVPGAAKKTVGTASDDVMKGASGNDEMLGGAGDDTITGIGGSNYLRGEDGRDKITGGTGFDDINGNAGDDTGSGGAGDDWVVGGKDNDVLYGDAGNDIVYGNLGSDAVYGGAGMDVLRGGQGDDRLFGGDGLDWLSGDRGDDVLTGGAGADTFNIFVDAGRDVITDFSRAQNDRIVVEGGAKYTTSQVGSDVVVSIVGGGELVLQNVSLSSLTGGWIFS